MHTAPPIILIRYCNNRRHGTPIQHWPDTDTHLRGHTRSFGCACRAVVLRLLVRHGGRSRTPLRTLAQRTHTPLGSDQICLYVQVGSHYKRVTVIPTGPAAILAYGSISPIWSRAAAALGKWFGETDRRQSHGPPHRKRRWRLRHRRPPPSLPRWASG